MPATTDPPADNVFTDADSALCATYDTLATQIADLEKTYRDLGIKFFALPSADRARYFGSDRDDAEDLFVGATFRETPRAARLLTALRPVLEEVNAHLHRVRYVRSHDVEFAAAETKLAKLRSAFERADACIRPFVDKMGGYYPYGHGGGASIPMRFAARLHGGGLPASGEDDRYADFRRFALTVREVQNSIALGESEEDAVASLSVEGLEKEEAIVPEKHEGEDGEKEEGEVSEDGYLTDSVEGSSLSNPWELADDDDLAAW